MIANRCETKKEASMSKSNLRSLLGTLAALAIVACSGQSQAPAEAPT
jgi:hypothetical protein